MQKDFREIPKEQFNARIPPELVERIVTRARKKGWGIGRTVTEAISVRLGIDPARYGIERDEQTV
jgi:predicted HicB family RNase H-like nuclease